MVFSKVTGNSSEEIFIVVVESPEKVNGVKPRERWTVNKKDFIKLLETLDVKYGLSIWKKKNYDKDLEWAGITTCLIVI